MRFNPKARLGPGQVSDGGRGGGGGGMGGGGMRIPIPGGTKAGGGIGGILIIILFVVLTQCIGGGPTGRRRHGLDPRPATGRQSRQTPAATTTARPAPTPTQTRTALAVAVVNSIQQLLGDDAARSRRGTEFTPARHRHLRRRRPAPAAAQATVAGRTVLLPARQARLPRHRLLRRRPRGAARRPGRRLRRGLRPRPRVRPPHPGPASAPWARSAPSRAPTATPCASSCRPTATPACGRARHQDPGRGRPGADLRPRPRRTSALAIEAAESVGDDRIQKKTVRAGQPRVVDPRLRGAAAALVHDGLPVRQLRRLRHVLGGQPLVRLRAGARRPPPRPPR